MGMGTGDTRSGRDKRLVPGACCYSVVESVISYIKCPFFTFSFGPNIDIWGRIFNGLVMARLTKRVDPPSAPYSQPGRKKIVFLRLFH